MAFSVVELVLIIVVCLLPMIMGMVLVVAAVLQKTGTSDVLSWASSSNSGDSDPYKDLQEDKDTEMDEDVDEESIYSESEYKSQARSSNYTQSEYRSEYSSEVYSDSMSERDAETPRRRDVSDEQTESDERSATVRSPASTWRRNNDRASEGMSEYTYDY